MLSLVTTSSRSRPDARRSARYSYAFQPIVDLAAGTVFSQEALVRGPAGEPAWSVFEGLEGVALDRFDRDGRVTAIAVAAAAGLEASLSLNCMPRALVALPDAISSTLEAATAHGIGLDRLILEITEGQVIADNTEFFSLLNACRAMGVKVAIDDFGAGFSGLRLLADFQPDQIKLDGTLVRGIERNGPRQSIVRAVMQVCADLGIDVVAEGVETVEEYRWFADHGTELFQGYLFARPCFERFASVHYPDAG